MKANAGTEANKRIVLGYDLATTTGFCVVTESGTIYESGVLDLGINRPEGEHYGHLFAKLYHHMAKVQGQYGNLQLAYEMAHHRAGPATRIGVGLNAMVLFAAASWSLPVPLAVHTATLKKWVTGDGRADKEQIKAWATVHIGRDPKDDNEADAVAVALWAVEQLKGVQP